MKERVFHFEVILDVDTLRIYKNSILNLLKQSVQDDAILGFSESDMTHDDWERYFTTLEEAVKEKILNFIIGKTRTDITEIVSICQIKRSLQPTTQHVADLQKGFIDPQYRGGHLLKNTLFAIAQHCQSQKIELITLDVRENTHAHKVWLRCGFKVYGILEDYSRYNGVSYKGVYMAQPTQQLYQFAQ